MYLSEAIRHEDSREHIMRVREISRRGNEPPSSPMHMSSPPQEPSSDPTPVEPETQMHSSHSPPFPTVPGPHLADDNPDLIYDDFDQVWGPSLATQSDYEEDEGDPTFDWSHLPPRLLSDNESETESAPDIDSLDAMTDGEESDTFDLEGFEGHGLGETEQELSIEEQLLESDEGSEDAWWPWPSREVCITLSFHAAIFLTLTKEALLDIMSSFPRSVFSEAELNATRWFASKCGVKDLPSVRQVKSHRSNILKYCGTDPSSKLGKMGNVFSILNLGKILADVNWQSLLMLNNDSMILSQEFANPLVRPHIWVFTEDSGERLAEACQAEKWKNDVHADLAGPMARHLGKDYFVNEPALAALGVGDDEMVAVLPSRWFIREGKLYARVQRLMSHPTEDCLLINNHSNSCEEVPLDSFIVPYPELQVVHSYHNLKNPQRIAGMDYLIDYWTMIENLISRNCKHK